ncbi:hypothetical protein D3C76_1038890 [compost metagenome]
MEYWVGNGYRPGCLRKASRAVALGLLRATTSGSCVGGAPSVGTGKVRGGGGRLGSSLSEPNSSNNSNCWVNGCAPNSGLGLPLVG